MGITYPMLKEKVKKRLTDLWKFKEETKDELIVQGYLKAENHYIEEEKLTEKMRKLLKQDCLVHRFLQKKGEMTLKESFVLIYENEGKLYGIDAKIKKNPNICIQSYTYLLDKNWKFDEVYLEELGRIYEKTLKEEIKNLNEFRLQFLFS